MDIVSKAAFSSAFHFAFHVKQEAKSIFKIKEL